MIRIEDWSGINGVRIRGVADRQWRNIVELFQVNQQPQYGMNDLRSR